MFDNVVSEMDDGGLNDLFGLSVKLRVVSRHLHLFNVQTLANKREEFSYRPLSCIRRKIQEDVKGDDSMI